MISRHVLLPERLGHRQWLRTFLTSPFPVAALGGWIRNRGIQSCRKGVEKRCGTVPSQPVHVVEKRNVGPERRQSPKKQCTVQFPGESARERTRVGDIHVPLAIVLRNGFEMDKLGENGRRRFRTPARQPRIAIGCIAHQCQIIRDRCRRDAELPNHTRFV